MKILAIASTLDLKYCLGCTPAWWQLFKALYETGNEVIVSPYLGDPVQSLWWTTYPNPCRWESITYNSYLERRKTQGVSPSKRNLLSPGVDFLIRHHVRPRWEKHVINILKKEKGIDAVVIMNVPMNHIGGIPSKIKQQFGVPVVFYDGDMPTSLPKYTVGRGFRFNYYVNADLAEYDALLANSEGCLSDLREMGAKKTYPLQWGIDPQLVFPVEMEKDIDISFLGYGSDFREEWMTKMITIPSKAMPDIKFAVGGGGFKIDLGNARQVGHLSYSEWRQFSCRSKINLNITRWSHSSIYASSTSRPFELAGFGACIVSQPYNGLEKWFDFGQDLAVVNSEDEAMAVYRQLLSDDQKMKEMGHNARKRVLQEHTFRHRAEELVNIIRALG